MTPPFTLTPKILSIVEEIGRLLGRFEGLHQPVPSPKLRRQNRIKTLQGSLAIEGNSLNIDQITALVDKKTVLGPKRDIIEVKNAIRLYDSLKYFNPLSQNDIFKAHRILMQNLDVEHGKYRSKAVGILKGSKVSHIAPPAAQVQRLMDHLFNFLKNEKSLSPLIKAAVFHYELEFIHPFNDGNGRIGRFWQTLILTKHNPAFEFAPVESIIKEKQMEYYNALESSDKKGNSTDFIEFSLLAIKDALFDFISELKPEPETQHTRLQIAKAYFKKNTFKRKNYLSLFKSVSTSTASRDLLLGVQKGYLVVTGIKATAMYRFK